jgi:hypothetical protein
LRLLPLAKVGLRLLEENRSGLAASRFELRRGSTIEATTGQIELDGKLARRTARVAGDAIHACSAAPATIRA